MSNLSDLCNEDATKVDQSVKLVGSLMGLLADISGTVGFAQLVGGLFSSVFEPSDDQVSAALSDIKKTIQADFAALQGQIAAGQILEKQEDVDNAVNDAETIFRMLPTIISDLPSLSEDYIMDKIQTCFAATGLFTDSEHLLWLLPAESAPQYSDSYEGAVPPPTSDGFVFNYTYTLPQFLRAVYFFWTVLAALKPSALTEQDMRDQFAKCAWTLKDVHDTIASGIVGTKIPSLDDTVCEYDPDNTGWAGWDSAWYDGDAPRAWPGDAGLWPYGAVEVYSGASIVDSYWPFLPFMIAEDSVPPNFFALLNLRIEDHKKALYKQLGLPVLRQVVNQLLGAAGQPKLFAHPYEDWSFKEAFAILGIPASSGGAFKALQAFLQATPPYSGGLLFPGESGETYPPSPLPKSFRSLFKTS